MARQHLCPVAVINLLAAQERRPEPTKVVKPLEPLLTGTEQPLADSPTASTGEARELQVSRPYGTPQVDLRQMLEGDVPQDQMTCYFL